MSNLDFDNDDFNPVDFINNQRKQSVVNAMEPQGEPDEAARAIQLGKATDTPPEIIHPDVEGFEKQHKARLTRDLLSNNQFLAEYARRPLAAQVSQNDWGAMDAISEQVQKTFPIVTAAAKVSRTALGEAAKGFQAGLNEEEFNKKFSPEELQRFKNYIDSPIWRGFATAAFPVAGTIEGSMAILQGATVGGAAYIASVLRQSGLHDIGGRYGLGSPEGAVRDIVAAAQVGVPELAGVHGTQLAWNSQLEKVAAATRAAAPHFKAGVEPPAGIHPLIDEAHKEQTKTDHANLKDLEKAVDGSQTKELAPEYTADFIRQHVQTNIGVSAEAIRNLYGDKLPEPGDGKFGDIPDLEAKLRAAESVGGDVDIPLEDWLTKIEPETRNEVRDDVRVRPEGLTPNEVKELKTEDTPIDLEDQIRQAAGLPPVSAQSGGLVARTTAEGAEWVSTGNNVRLRIKPAELWTQNEQKIFTNLNRELERILPNWARHVGAETVELNGVPVQGLFQQFHDQAPLIAWSLGDSVHPLNTVRHEALHFLRQMGLFTEGEWSTLISHALEQGWMDKYDIHNRYKGLDESAKLEEAIAEGFAEWRAGAKTSDSVHPVFEKIKATLEAIKKTVLEAIGATRDITAQDLFLAADLGEIGRREPKPLRSDLFQPQAQKKLPEGISVDPSAVGLNRDQYLKHLQLIYKQREEIANARAESVKKAEARRQTKEWRDNRRDMLKEVTDNIARRPDIAADNFVRSGDFYGSKVRGNTRLREDSVPEDLRAVLKDHIAKDGLDPDDIAGQFGFSTGSEMVNRISELAKQREASGLQPDKFLKRVAESETDRKMEAKYGRLDDNILSDVKDQLYSKTQFDLLNEDMLRAAEKAGVAPVDRTVIEKDVREQFKNVTLKNANENKFLQLSGKAGRQIQDLMRAGKWDEALKYQAAQFRALLMAKEAKAVEKEMKKFDAQAKTNATRERDSIEQEYLNWTHWIYTKIGKPIKRTEADLRAELGAGDFNSFQDFIDRKRGDLLEVEAPEWLDENFQKDYEHLTVEQFRAIRDAVQSIITAGRNAKVVIKGGLEQDYERLRDRAIEGLEEFSKKNYDSNQGRWLGPIPPSIARPIRTYWASSLQMESLFYRWDHGDSNGVFSRWFFRPLAAAANARDAMGTAYSKKVLDLGKPNDLKRKIDNPIFHTPGGDLMPMTRKNLLAVMLNMGNEGNLTKLAKGYNLDPQSIRMWVDKYATKEDWQWVQKVGDIFADLKVEADDMYRRMSGLAPTSIEITPFQTPHGEMKGWYYPLIADELWKPEKGGKNSELAQENYVRATTPRGYTKERTGAVYPLSLQLDAMTNRMGQMIHDITMREAVTQFAKLAYDNKLKNKIKERYGKEYSDLLEPYIRDVANVSNYMSAGDRVFAQWSEYFRQNMIQTLVGFNLGTVEKHGPTALVNSITEVGLKEFSKAAFSLLKVNDETSEWNWKFVRNKSQEIQRRHQHYIETLGGADKIIQGEMTFRELVRYLSSYPVAFSDLLSAVPTWLAKYNEGMKLHGIEGDAIEAADTAVRRAHGSSAITSRPGIARGGPLSTWVSSLYGFFSHILNRQYEMAWRAKEAAGLAGSGDVKGALKEVPKITGMFFSYVLFPAFIEAAVMGELTQDEPWIEKVAKMLATGLSSSWVGVRDAAGALMYNRDPSMGLTGTALKTLAATMKDIKKLPDMDEEQATIAFQRANATLGLLTGWSNAEVGRLGRYLYNVSQGNEVPEDLFDIHRGYRYGTQRERH